MADPSACRRIDRPLLVRFTFPPPDPLCFPPGRDYPRVKENPRVPKNGTSITSMKGRRCRQIKVVFVGKWAGGGGGKEARSGSYNRSANTLIRRDRSLVFLVSTRREKALAFFTFYEFSGVCGVSRIRCSVIQSVVSRVYHDAFPPTDFNEFCTRACDAASLVTYR